MPMYAIVKTGGKQYKVAVGDVVQVEKLEGEPGAEVSFPALLVVDGSDSHRRRRRPGQGLGDRQGGRADQGPKIRIHKFKNKTGYHKRQGHRQKLTRVEVTGIA